MAKLVDAPHSKCGEVTPHVGSIPTLPIKYNKGFSLSLVTRLYSLLHYRTSQDAIKFRDSLNPRQKRIIVRVIYRLKDKGYSTIDDHLGSLAKLSRNINHLERCWSY
jgi:hypothetical protein